ncbi:hypothetical protein COU14_00240 [Candidatus Kaiserbacteria bacterium CG10_big_fil_rev_8_21_14_0_10_44_10]|uniref:Uncharacterized protein n=1 Tax=Candidatus Kaiserbacteria bacterium CG10_big_fil_rev_8_21_14_0_10_44_10 TaxID=1974606 RepID=A0A2H0UIJ8_9BACT|nr:MAG: hypothetical protein COU14_00240 [Candidatus Kaiserbacteria bacterium CG10_big_fil_rev_8_21_14_0_10_44_10]
MSLFGVDYSKKLLHVAVASVPEQREGEDAVVIHGLVFNPKEVFSKINTSAEQHYAELFRSNQIYRTVVVETEMGPGELVQMLCDKFSGECCIWIGGIIAPFSMDPSRVDELLQELVSQPESYTASGEKLRFAS